MKVIKHIIIVCVCLFAILGIPFLFLYSKTAGGTDAVTGASVIIDQPSGDYMVFINKDRRRDEETMATWESFFSGREISYVFEDIVCCVAENDTAGYTMAQSFQSRLPENQMVIRKEDGTLMMSKADTGRYDIIIMSKEAAKMYNVDTLEGRDDSITCLITSAEEN